MVDILTVDSFTLGYGNRDVVVDFCLRLHGGTTMGLLGPNGAGKSSVLHAVVGLLQPTRGAAFVCGEPATSEAARSLLGFAPDDMPTPLSLTGAETIQLVARLRRGLTDLEFAHRLCEILGLTSELGKPVGAYSHGMRRKLQLICAVAHLPMLLILDEPLRGLDPEAAAGVHAILDLVRGYGGSVLMATHDLDGAARYCDEVAVIASGHLVASGSPAQIQFVAGGVDSLGDAFIRLSGIDRRLTEQRQQLTEAFAAAAGGGREPATMGVPRLREGQG